MRWRSIGKRICDGESSAKRLQDDMEKMVKHQSTRGQNITPKNDREDQNSITNTYDGETSTKRICNGEESEKEYAIAKHRLKDGKIT